MSARTPTPDSEVAQPDNPLSHATPWGEVLEWRLPRLMGAAGFRFSKGLHAALLNEGIELTYGHVNHLTQHAPKRLTVDVQFALCRILGCEPGDLWQSTGEVAVRAEPANRSELKNLKPVRARGLE